MQNMLKSKIFWLVVVLAAVVIFLITLNNSSRGYRGETDILFLPKSGKAVRNIDQIIANAQAIPRSLSFYDKLLERNQDIEDLAAGFADPRRKDFWDSKLSVERAGASGIVRVNVSDSNPLQAEIVSRQTASDMVTVMSRYYDTNNDLDMRVIDGPIVFLANQNKTSIWIVLSILLGIVAGMIAYLFSSLVKTVTPKTILAKPAIFGRGKTGEPKKEEPKIFTAPAEEAPYFAAGKKAGAPENLPIGSKFVMNALKRTKEAQEEKAEEAEKFHEATPEEVRERLNKLLSGGM